MKSVASEPEKFEEKIRNKTFLLDKFVKPKSMAKHAGKLKLISSKFKKEKKLFAIPPEKIKYDLFLKLNNIWKEYIEELVSKEYELFRFFSFENLYCWCIYIFRRSQENIFNKLLKADYHGAIIKSNWLIKSSKRS